MCKVFTILKMETAVSSEMSTNNHLSKWHHTAEYSSIKIDIN